MAPSKMTLATLFAMTAISVKSVDAHSWIEQMQLISDNGSFTGDMGYPRGYMARTDSGYNGDSMDYLIPALDTQRTRINGSDLLCHPSQRTQNYSSNYPMLQVSPGGYFTMKYLENGHVTLPQNQKGKPPAAGTVFIYATTQPKDDEKILDVLQWTHDGKGGDGRGKILAAQSFDDGRCHQISSATLSVQRQQQFPDHVPGQPASNVEQWCETDVKIPTDQAAGSKLAVYWLWQWPTAAGADPTYPDGKDEYYSTCMDLDLVSTECSSSGTSQHTLQQQDPQTAACSDFQSRTAQTQSPSITTQAAAYSSVAAFTPGGSSAAASTSAVATSSSTSTQSSASSSASASATSSSSSSLASSTSAPGAQAEAVVTTSVTVTASQAPTTVMATSFVTVTQAASATLPTDESTSTASSTTVLTSSSSSTTESTSLPYVNLPGTASSPASSASSTAAQKHDNADPAAVVVGNGGMLGEQAKRHLGKRMRGHSRLGF